MHHRYQTLGRIRQASPRCCLPELLGRHLRPRPRPAGRRQQERSRRLSRPRAFLPRVLSDQRPAVLAAGRALPPRRRRRQPGVETHHTVWRRQVPHARFALPRRAANGKRSTRSPRARPCQARQVRTAVFDGQFFSPANGKDFPAAKARPTPSGAGSPGPSPARPATRSSARTTRARVAPGGDDIVKLLGDDANLILLDEVLEYLISAGGIKVLDTTLRDETLSFIKRLTVAGGQHTQERAGVLAPVQQARIARLHQPAPDHRPPGRPQRPAPRAGRR